MLRLILARPWHLGAFVDGPVIVPKLLSDNRENLYSRFAVLEPGRVRVAQLQADALPTPVEPKTSTWLRTSCSKEIDHM
jgi:hypothetical protein